jgi:hypothetical protein
VLRVDRQHGGCDRRPDLPDLDGPEEAGRRMVRREQASDRAPDRRRPDDGTRPGRHRGAKADGSWSKLDASHALDVPKDLADALAGDADAERNFGAFPPSACRAILQRIDAAKKPETRAKRIAETARLANPERARQPAEPTRLTPVASRAFLPWTASMLHYQVRGR